MATTDARPVPIRNQAYRITFVLYDSAGAPVVAAAGLDSEISKDAAAFADCTNEATEIGQGYYYLDLTAAEMNADTVALVIKTSTSGALTTHLVLYPSDLSIEQSVYQAKIWMTDDDAGVTDRYLVIWYKNGEPVAVSVTLPTLTIYRVSDGSALISGQTLTQVGTTAAYRHNEASARMVDGVSYVALASAVIDGATRTALEPISRDS